MPEVGDGWGGGVVDEWAAMSPVLQTRSSVPMPSIVAAFQSPGSRSPLGLMISGREMKGDASGTRFKACTFPSFLGSRMNSWFPPSRPAKG